VYNDNVARPAYGGKSVADGILTLLSSGNHGGNLRQVVRLDNLHSDGREIAGGDHQDDSVDDSGFLKHGKRPGQHRHAAQQKVLFGDIAAQSPARSAGWNNGHGFHDHSAEKRPGKISGPPRERRYLSV
jgi:hypothetical protein